MKGKERAQMIARNTKVDAGKRAEKAEIAEWFDVWLKQPEVFDVWLEIRRRAADFREKFGATQANGEQ